ncbi:uncharacterized protein zfp91 isoform 2-T2 [Clarias gariepinus]
MMEVQRVEKNEKREKDEAEEAARTSPDSSVTRTPRRALRGRGATRANSAAPPPASSPDANGTQSAPGSGRVLRDRSTRSVPVWRRRDLGAEQEEEEEEEDEEGEEEEEAETRRRRRAACPRRRRNAEAARDSKAQCGDSKDTSGTRAGSRRAQSRSRTSSSRGARASARVVCKSEPETETTCAEENKSAEKKISTEKKSEVKKIEVLQGEKEPPFTDDPKDQTYEPHAQSEDNEGVSSDEDVPFKDDLNDQSYDPKSGRETQKPRRRAPSRAREKKEKAGEKDKETEVKTEGVETTDVKQEAAEGAEPPRKRGRRRKDDKSPRLPKRRKKPPVQYVRCEMEGCGTVLAHPRYLQHHIKYQHLMKKKYVCPHPSCGRLFRLQKQLLRHAKHHTDQRDYICEFCARAFKSSHNLAVHRMIHTGEKPLQCEICGFTCRQKASLNWHMKKHDADASYQFSCAICGKKFEKKDSVVAHKAKSHPEVLIAEALAANAGALVGTPAPTTTQVTPVGVSPVMLLDQEQSLHTMQVPVSLTMPSTDEVKRETEGGGVSAANPASSSQTLHFLSAPVSQQQLSVQATPQIVHMTFTTLSQQLPLLSVTHQLPPSTSSAPSVSLLPQITSVAFTAEPAPPHPPPPTSPPPQGDRKEGGALWDGGTENVGGVWEAGGAGEVQVVTDSSDGTIQHRMM